MQAIAHLLTVYLYAAIVAGETGDICPPPAQIAVANTIQHRVEMLHLQPTTGYYGWLHNVSIQQSHIDAVQAALSGVDIVPGALYALSDEDLKKLHFTARPDYRATCRYGLHINFYIRYNRNTLPTIDITNWGSNGVQEQKRGVAFRSQRIAKRSSCCVYPSFVRATRPEPR